jgi:hypothetical protein
MNTIESLRAITRRAIPMNYHSPGVCHLPVPSGSGSGSSSPSELDFNPVRQKAGPPEIFLTLEGADVRVSWALISYAYSYVVYRSTSPLGPFLLAASNVLVDSYLDEGLASGDYYYKVTSIEKDYGETTASPVTGPINIP